MNGAEESGEVNEVCRSSESGSRMRAHANKFPQLKQ